MQGRVDALSNAHVILADGRWRDVPLERLLSIEAEHLGRQVTLAGPLVQITSAQVQPLPLVVHELIANTVRLGSLSVSAGTMSISWEINGPNVVLEMNERHGPPVASAREPGFGTTIVRTIVERQLRGTIAYDWHRSGLRTVITIPSEAAATAQMLTDL